MNPIRVSYNKKMEEYNKKRKEVKVDKQSGLEQSSSEVKEEVKEEKIKMVVVEKKD